MEYVADLHLHSKYSRAVSRDMILPEMARVGKQKGLNILSTSDWTHPLWFKEISHQLEEKTEGLYGLKKSTVDRPQSTAVDSSQNAVSNNEPLFLLSVEIASIYSQGGKLRRIHNLIFAPNLETAAKISKELIRRGCNLMSDGRPIVGLSSKQLLEIVLAIDQRVLLIPCHVWTPHFGIYGSASGFDSLDEAFGDLASYIYGVETGLSSDPEMNWQIRELLGRSILSFSDAHSPAKMGREATVFVRKDRISNNQFPITNNKENITFEDIRLAIMRKSGKWNVGYTIEFYPEEGKYHFSGHRNCKIVLDPEQIRQKGSICPVCKKTLTEGVLYRLEQLSDKNMQNRASKKVNKNNLQWHVDNKKVHPPFVKLVPLNEIIAQSLDSTVSSQKVKSVFASLCSSLGSEVAVLLKVPIADIEKMAGPKIAEGVEKVRKGDIIINPGYDGEYGKVEIWHAKNGQSVNTEVLEPSQEDSRQMGLFGV